MQVGYEQARRERLVRSSYDKAGLRKKSSLGARSPYTERRKRISRPGVCRPKIA
jgi:hypothetical protein